MLTVAILSTAVWKFFNASRSEEIQSTRAIGFKSVPLTADAMLWMGAATVPISELAFLAASRAASTVVTSGLPSWSLVIS